MGTNVDALSHFDILDKTRPADAGKVTGASDRLYEAADRIQLAVEKLRIKTTHVVWHGPAADAFRTWSEQVTKAGLDLAGYARTTGFLVGVVGSQLADAKARMPQLPEQEMQTVAALQGDATQLARVDPATGKTGADRQAELQRTISDAHQAAMSQMRVIVSAYGVGAQQLQGLATPVFPKPVNVMRVEPADEEDVGGATGMGAATAVGLSSANSGSGAVGARPRVSGGTAPSQPVGAWPVAPTGGVPSVLMSDQPVGFASGPTTGFGGGSGYTPGGPGTGLAASGVPSGATPNLNGAQPPSHTAGPGEHTANRTGFGVAPGEPLPVTGGVERPAGAPGRAGGEVRVTPHSGGVAESPKSVSGGNHGTGARAGIPMGGVPGAVSQGMASGSGPRGGARPIGMPGGVIGGRPSAAGEASGRRAFSPGGSGLRPGSQSESAARAAPSETSRGDHGARGSFTSLPGSADPGSAQVRRRRAEYLQADDDEWNGRGPGPVPPVIG
jgi:hypothetical protein